MSSGLFILILDPEITVSSPQIATNLKYKHRSTERVQLQQKQSWI
jgi:hypothetical protein